MAGAGPFKPATRVDSLAEQRLADLRSLSRASGCTMHSAAMATVAVASSLLTGSTQAIMMAHQTGQPRYSRRPLIGFCVDLLPITVELSDDTSLMDVSKDVQAQIVAGSEIASGLYRVFQDQRYRQQPAALVAFEYAYEGTEGMFGAPAFPMMMPRESMPRPALVTFEEHRTGIELISEISEVSDLAPHGPYLAAKVEQILSDPTVPLGELRRR
jgi:hypothetical protein